MATYSASKSCPTWTFVGKSQQLQSSRQVSLTIGLIAQIECVLTLLTTLRATIGNLAIPKGSLFISRKLGLAELRSITVVAFSQIIICPPCSNFVAVMAMAHTPGPDLSSICHDMSFRRSTGDCIVQAVQRSRIEATICSTVSVGRSRRSRGLATFFRDGQVRQRRFLRTVSHC